MTDYEVKTESEIKGPNKPEEKKPSLASRIVDVVLTVLLVISIGISACVIFVNVRFVSCFVSGMSMFPTFNATGLNSAGEYLDPYNPSESTQDGSKVDFLLCDEEDWQSDLKRFDIVCSYYDEDYYNGELLSNRAPKIKRVIGFPGEYIFLVTSSDENYKYCGDLYVSIDSRLQDADLTLGPVELKNQGYSILKVKQPLLSSTYDEMIKATKGENALYNDGEAVSYSWCWSLDATTPTNAGQYLLLGDNRANSYSKDSRYVGPINASYVQGKIVCGLGLGTISNNGSQCKFDFLSFNWRSF